MSFLQSNSAKKAICYHRHSAEDKQENSVPIQREHAEKLAKKHNIEIIHEEADEGVSGLTDDRPAFKRLFSDWIQNPDAPHFDYIFVYDVSRWGRFQNQNTAAYYEHICEKNGKKVIYVSRGMPKEGHEQGLTDSIITPIERFMAAQYSKQLSEKVWFGCMKVTRDGYSAGGMPCYGMGRLLLDVNKKPVRMLNAGEHKQIGNERVTFVPLGDDTNKTIKDIYHMFVNEWKSMEDIAEILNDKGIPAPKGQAWNRQKILRVLSNETYTGTLIYNKVWGRLKQKKVRNPRSEWSLTTNAFPAIISSEIFWQAQERLFWIIPCRWSKGPIAVDKVKKAVRKELEQLLRKQGIEDDEIDIKIKKLRIIFSVKLSDTISADQYFVVDEQTRNLDKIFAVSVAPDKKGLIDRVLLIPSDQFNKHNFMVLSETDERYMKYTVENSKIQETVLLFS